jgi:hypothetical protein
MRLTPRLRLPASNNELATVLDGIVPRPAWGEPLTYQMVGGSDFTLFAITPSGWSSSTGSAS